MGLLALLGVGVLRSVEPYRREGWAGPIPLVALHAAAPLFDGDGEPLVTPLNPAWVTWVDVEPTLRDFVASGLVPASALTLPSNPTRWQRVLLARQCGLAAGRLRVAGDSANINADLERVYVITRLLTEDERASLTGPIGRLVESSRDEPQATGLELLRRVGAGTDDHLDRIAELARTSPSSQIRKSAYDTAAIVASSEAAAVEILRSGLRDESSHVRQMCAARLEGLAKWGRPALDDLDRLVLKDWDSWVRASAEAAAEMIRRLGGK
jgi:hypothetical protein